MSNTFNLQSSPRQCLWISPFFWALIILCIALIILIVMALLYHSLAGKKYFHQLECIFHHFNLIGNAELWFGGPVSSPMIILIGYTFVFGSFFLDKYPMETSTDADYACDPSLRNTQLSSSLQLLATIKSEEEEPLFSMPDSQDFFMTVHFIQTGFTCRDIAAQVDIRCPRWLWDLDNPLCSVLVSGRIREAIRSICL